MIRYWYSKITYCLYAYNTKTDHWIIKSPEILKNSGIDTLERLNDGCTIPSDLVEIGKARMTKLMTEQWKDVNEVWTYSGRTFKSGNNLETGDNKYHILYYQGNAYPVQYYISSTDTYVLRSGKDSRFSVSAKHCAPIYEILPDGTTVNYGKSNI